jgi:hypothetical protein
MSNPWDDAADADDLPLNPAVTGAQEFLEEILELLDDEDYQFADTTLTGIYDTVSRTGRVTPGQRRAVDNIGSTVENRR